MSEEYEQHLGLIPEHMRDGVKRYIEHGIPGDSFMTAVFSNELIRACQAADWCNRSYLPSWAEFLMHCPYPCYGTPGKVDAWIRAGGLRGIMKIANATVENNEEEEPLL